jgi:hypothetical protein
MTNLCVWPGGLIDNYFKTVGKWEIILMIYMFIIYVLKNWNPGWSKKEKKNKPICILEHILLKVFVSHNQDNKNSSPKFRLDISISSTHSS